MTKDEEFDIASRAFDVFERHERIQVLERFARLHYPSIKDRFFEAVHHVIIGNRTTEATHD